MSEQNGNAWLQRMKKKSLVQAPERPSEDTSRSAKETQLEHIGNNPHDSKLISSTISLEDILDASSGRVREDCDDDLAEAVEAARHEGRTVHQSLSGGGRKLLSGSRTLLGLKNAGDVRVVRDTDGNIVSVAFDGAVRRDSFSKKNEAERTIVALGATSLASSALQNDFETSKRSADAPQKPVSVDHTNHRRQRSAEIERRAQLIQQLRHNAQEANPRKQSRAEDDYAAILVNSDSVPLETSASEDLVTDESILFPKKRPQPPPHSSGTWKATNKVEQSMDAPSTVDASTSGLNTTPDASVPQTVPAAKQRINLLARALAAANDRGKEHVKGGGLVESTDKMDLLLQKRDRQGRVLSAADAFKQL